MSGSVQNNGSASQVDQLSVLPVSSSIENQSLEDEDGVSIGYSPQSSSELVEAESITGTDTTSLDAPKISSQNEVEELETFVYNRQLSGLKEVVSYFNDRFDIDTLNMADTASIFLLIKGMVSDMKVLSGAENVDSALQSLLTQYDVKIRAAEKITTHIQDMTDKQGEKEEYETLLNDKDAYIEEKTQILTQKTNELASASGSDYAALEEEIELLNQQIESASASDDELQESITSLDIEIESLNSSIQDLSIQLRKELPNTRDPIFIINQGIKQNYERTRLKTGEEQRTETKNINTTDDKKHLEIKKQISDKKKEMIEKDKQQIEITNKRALTVENTQQLEQFLKQANITKLDTLSRVLDSLNVDVLHDKHHLLDEFPSEKELLETVKIFDAILNVLHEKDKDFNVIAEATNSLANNQSEANKIPNLLNNREEISIPFDLDARLTNAGQHDSGNENKNKNKNKKVLPTNPVKENGRLPKELEPLENLNVVTTQMHNEGDSVDPTAVSLSSVAEVVSKLEALKLESKALSLVMEAETERLATERAIRKNTPV